MKHSEPKADGFKQVEIDEARSRLSGVQLLGDGPNYKRKRSYWRAVRRGEVWALLPLSTRWLATGLEADLYGWNIPAENRIFDRWVPDSVMYLIRKNK